MARFKVISTGIRNVLLEAGWRAADGGDGHYLSPPPGVSRRRVMAARHLVFLQLSSLEWINPNGLRGAATPVVVTRVRSPEGDEKYQLADRVRQCMVTEFHPAHLVLADYLESQGRGRPQARRRAVMRRELEALRAEGGMVGDLAQAALAEFEARLKAESDLKMRRFGFRFSETYAAATGGSS